MDYQKHYDTLIERARNRTIDGYFEKHHVLAKCMGGSNDVTNIVRLTPEEHYVAHQLLVMIHPGNASLICAAVKMTNGNKRIKRNNKLYGWLRKELSNVARQRFKGLKREPMAPDVKLKLSLAHKGKKFSEEHKKNMSLCRIGKKRPPRTDEWRRNQTLAVRASMLLVDRSYMRTPEYKAIQSLRTTEQWEKRRAGLIPNRKPHNKKTA